jgi:glutamate dehydrogenase (NADP+)
VAVSGLEMAQNSQRLAWSAQEVDAKLKNIMTDCYQVCTTLPSSPLIHIISFISLQTCLNAGSKWTGENLTGGVLPSLLAGANVAGFIKVADAMRAQGDWW